ncbi:MAG: mechanosensitive ion channel family protein [Candidatus Woesearchaeota archaeon]
MSFLDTLYFGNTIKQYLLFFAYIAIAFLVGRILYYISTNIIKKFTSKTKTKLDDIIIDMIEEPIVFLVVIAGFFFAYHQLNLSEKAYDIFNRIFKILVISAISWLIIRLIDALIVNYLMPLSEKTKTDLDDLLFPLIRKIVKISLTAVAIIMILDNMGYHVTSILAGLGIGGLAFALAAQDLLGNFFGGLTIIIDKPFKVGEYIQIGDVQGEIVEIGLRSTKLKTPNGEFITIPNKFITEKATINHKRLNQKLVIMTLNLVYNTSNEKMKKAKKIIQEILSKEKLIFNYEVNFINFGAYSLDLEVRYFIETNQPKLVREIKDKINFKIKEEFEKNKIDFAYPTQTIEMKK